MKNLKMNLLMVAALAIAAVTMSFTLVQNSSLASEKWFEYTNATEDGDINNPANYVLANGDGSLPPCPIGVTERCAVRAKPIVGNTDRPNLETIVDTKLRKQQ